MTNLKRPFLASLLAHLVLGLVLVSGGMGSIGRRGRSSVVEVVGTEGRGRSHAPLTKPLSRSVGPANEQAPGSDGASGNGQAVGGQGFGEQGSYLDELRSVIEAHKRYPIASRRLGETGSVTVAFRIEADGMISEARILSPSRYERLNEAALSLVQGIRQFRAPPAQIAQAIEVPIEYTLR